MKKTKKHLSLILKSIENPRIPINEGIYYSHRTERIFEARIKKGKVHTQYLEGDFGPVIEFYIWNIQYSYLELYDLLAEY